MIELSADIEETLQCMAALLPKNAYELKIQCNPGHSGMPYPNWMQESLDCYEDAEINPERIAWWMAGPQDRELAIKNDLWWSCTWWINSSSDYSIRASSFPLLMKGLIECMKFESNRN